MSLLSRALGVRSLAVLAIVAPAAVRRADAQAKFEVYRDRGDLVLDVGPTELPAHAMHDMVQQPPTMSHVLGVSGWLHGYRIEIVDSAGDEVPQRVLHHVAILDPQARELFTPMMLRLAGAGSETAPVTIPRLFGFHVTPDDSVVVTLMLHNPSDRAYHGVHVRIRMPLASGRSWVPTVAIYPFWMDVTPPTSTHSFDLPPGRSEQSWEGKPAVNGRILGVSGHLHKYGVELRLEDITAHRVLWRAKPDTDSTGDIRAIPFGNFIWKLGVAVDTSHVYRLTAVYDNPTDTTIVDGGMGVLGGVFHPASDASWPAVDRTNAEYQYDVKETWHPSGPMHMQP